MSKTWGDDSKLKGIKNPYPELPYVLTCITDEITFEGSRSQPDFGLLEIRMAPGKQSIELKSLKEYLFTFRGEHISYERFIGVVFRALMGCYSPNWLTLKLSLKPRGGIRSDVFLDSREVDKASQS